MLQNQLQSYRYSQLQQIKKKQWINESLRLIHLSDAKG